MNEETRSRYPGTRPFTDSPDDYVRFFGRAEESEQLYLRVLSVPLLVQFGSSGLGKTSLLQAGLFPRLRQKPFLPVMVRLNVPGESLTAAVARSIRQSCEAEGVVLDAGKTDGLWELLSTTTVWRGDFLLTPVLVFDQFEEVFTLRDDAFRADVAAELGALASGIPPERLRAQGAASLPEVKIVISLREDYLGFLEQFSAAIPGLFHERLRLEALNVEHARESITGPAKLVAGEGEQPYSSPPFDFEPDALAAMLDDLKGRSGVIEPFHLQLLCRNAEAIARRKATPDGAPVTLTTADFRGSASFEAVLANFYRDTLRLLPGASQRKKAEALCQEGLLGASGHRLMPEEGQILSDFGVTRQTLDVLCQARLIRRERRLESVYYEVSHDRLAETIFNARKSRMPRKVKRAIAGGAFLGVAIVGVLVFWLVTVSRARESSDRMLRFLLGEQFLGDVRDSGRSVLLERVENAVGNPEERDDLSAVNRGLALRNSGDILRMHGSLRGALEKFSLALPLFEASPDDSALREAARTHERLALGLADSGRRKEALTHLDAAVKAWIRVADHPDPLLGAGDCFSLADSLVSSAGLKNGMGQVPGAVADVQKASMIVFRQLFGSIAPGEPCAGNRGPTTPYPDPKAIQALSGIAMARANLFGYDEDGGGAAALAMEARRLNPASISARSNALDAVAWRAVIGESDTPAEALKDGREYLSEAEEMRRWDPENRQWQRERAVAELLVSGAILTCRRKGLPYFDTPRQLDDARVLTLDAAATMRSLTTLDPANVTWQTDLAWALREQSEILGEQAAKAEQAAALALQNERLQLLRAAEQICRMPSLRQDVETQRVLAGLLTFEADTLAKLGRFSEARTTVQSAVEMATQLTRRYPDSPGFLEDVTNARAWEAHVLVQAGDAAGAEVSKREANLITQKREEILGGNREELARLGELDKQHAESGQRLGEEENYAGALREFRGSEDAGRQYFRLRPIEWGVYRDLSYAYSEIARWEDKLGHHEQEGAARNAAMHPAQLYVWLAPPEERERTKANDALLERRFDLGLYLQDHDRADEALPVMLEVAAVEQALSNDFPKDAFYLYWLGFAEYQVGKIRRARGKQEGWEEALRSGIIHLQRAAELDAKSFPIARRLGEARNYLAEELDRDKRGDRAAVEYAGALAAYEKAAAIDPTDAEVQTAADELRAKLNRG